VGCAYDSLMPEARDRADHEARVQRPERLGVEAVALEAADLEVFDDDVGVGREAPDQGATLGGLEIGRDAALAAVAAMEIGGAEVARLAAVPGSDEGRSPLARVVAAAGALHLDHVGPEIRQQLPAPWPGQDTGQFENADAVEGGGGGGWNHGSLLRTAPAYGAPAAQLLRPLWHASRDGVTGWGIPVWTLTAQGRSDQPAQCDGAGRPGEPSSHPHGDLVTNPQWP